MKQILFTNWNFRRILFLGVGIFIGIQSIQQKEWMGVIFGSYFTLMGIFQLKFFLTFQWPEVLQHGY